MIVMYERDLLELLARLDNNNDRAIVLQGFIQLNGPLSEEAGAKVREMLNERSADL